MFNRVGVLTVLVIACAPKAPSLDISNTPTLHAPLAPNASSLPVCTKRFTSGGLPRSCTESQDAHTYCTSAERKTACSSAAAMRAWLLERSADAGFVEPTCQCSTSSGSYSVILYKDPLSAREFFFDDATSALAAVRDHGDSNRFCGSSSLSAWFGPPLPTCSALAE